MSIKLLFLGFFLGAWVGLGAIQAEAAQTQPYVAGTILTTAQYGDKTFVGGTFDSIGQLTGPLGLVDATSGNLSKAFSQITGTVLTITPDSRGGWFIGGVDNSSRGFLVRLKSDMSLDSSFGSNLSINGSVHTVAVHNNLIYFGGQFTKVNGQDRKALAAVDLTSNQLYNDLAIYLNPNEGNPNVQALIASRGVLYIAGAFESIKGVPRRGVAAIDGAGAVSDFTIVMPDQYDVTAILPVVDGVIISIRTRVNGSTFAGWLVKYNSKTKLVAWSQRIENSASALFDYRGVAYTNVQRSTGGQGFAQFAYGTAFDQATGKVLPWDPHTDGQITSIAVNGQSVYIGGYFRE